MAIADDVTWHQIHLERYKVGVQRKMVNQLASSRKAVLKRIRILAKRIESGESKAYWTMKRLQEQRRQIEGLLNKQYAELNKILETSNNELTHNEILWNKNNLGKYVGVGVTVAAPPASAIYSAVVERPFEGWLKDGKLSYVHDSPLRNIPKKHKEQLDSVIKDAFITGQTNQDAAKRLEAANALIAKADKGYDISRRNIETETRTSLQTYANRAREETYLANADLFPWLEYLATLDSRTTEVCASLDGRTYRVEDESRPVIPQHWNCRSTYVPKKTKDEDVGIERPAVSAGSAYERGDNKTKAGKVRRPRKGSKKLKRYTVDGNTKFNDWLKKQDKENPEFVRDYFKTDARYEAWKKGKLGKVKYTSVDGREYNIKSLNALKGSPIMRQNLDFYESAETARKVAGVRVKKIFDDKGNHVGAIFEDEDAAGLYYYARYKGKTLPGRFKTVNEAEDFLRKEKLTKKKRAVSKKKVVAKKVAKKKVTKKRATKKGELVEKLMTKRGRRYGGVFRYYDEAGNPVFQARYKGKIVGEYSIMSDAIDKIKELEFGKSVSVVKKTGTGPYGIRIDERRLNSKNRSGNYKFEGDLDDDELNVLYEIPDEDLIEMDSVLAAGASRSRKRRLVQRIYENLYDSSDDFTNKIKKHLKVSMRGGNRAYAIDKMSKITKSFNGYFPNHLKQLKKTRARAYASSHEQYINVGRADERVLFHEVGHFVEFENPDIAQAMIRFRNRRAKHHFTTRLSKLTGNSRYGPDEVAYDDKFFSHYVGKKYPMGYNMKLGELEPTEVFSMGYENFTSVETMLRFLEKDPEHFRVIYGAILKIRRMT